MKRVLITLIAAVLSFPVGGLIAFLCTPLLWRLEGLFHVELAGHSGPSDWILIAAGLMATFLGGIAAGRYFGK